MYKGVCSPTCRLVDFLDTCVTESLHHSRLRCSLNHVQIILCILVANAILLTFVKINDLLTHSAQFVRIVNCTCSPITSLPFPLRFKFCLRHEFRHLTICYALIRLRFVCFGAVICILTRLSSLLLSTS